MSLSDLPSIRLLGEWMEKNGVGLAFIAVTMVLLFTFFLRLIFKKPPTEKIEDIYILVLEIKLKLEQLLGKKEIEK
jgi:hypothetical protein